MNFEEKHKSPVYISDRYIFSEIKIAVIASYL